MKRAVLVLVFAASGCPDKHESEPTRAPPAPPPPKMFTCLKLPGPLGRACVGPGGKLAAASPKDAYQANEAWCVISRAGWADTRSRMICVPTEAECETDLSSSSRGVRPRFLRTPCTKTLPADWTGALAPFYGGAKDAFVCTEQRDFYEGGTVMKCEATPGELLPSQGGVDKAWCYSYWYDNTPDEELRMCFGAELACLSDHKNTKVTKKEACIEDGPARSLAASPFAKDDK